MENEERRYIVDNGVKDYNIGNMEKMHAVDWAVDSAKLSEKIIRGYRKRRNYVFDVPLSKKIQQCENITEEYNKKVAQTFDVCKLRDLRKQLIHDFINASPDLDWFSIDTYLFPAFFPDIKTSSVLRISKWLAVRDHCLEEFAKAYEANKFDNHVFNKVVKLFGILGGQGQDVLRKTLNQEKFELAMKENAGIVSYFDSVIINRIFMIENIARRVRLISRVHAYDGCEFVKDCVKFANNFSANMRGNERYIADICHNIVNLNQESFSTYSLTEKSVKEKIMRNITHVHAVKVTNKPGKHMFLKLRYITMETYTEEVANGGQQTERKPVVNKLSMYALKKNLPKGITLNHVLADKCCLTFDKFDITKEMLDHKIDACSKGAAVYEAEMMQRK